MPARCPQFFLFSLCEPTHYPLFSCMTRLPLVFHLLLKFADLLWHVLSSGHYQEPVSSNSASLAAILPSYVSTWLYRARGHTGVAYWQRPQTGVCLVFTGTATAGAGAEPRMGSRNLSAGDWLPQSHPFLCFLLAAYKLSHPYFPSHHFEWEWSQWLCCYASTTTYALLSHFSDSFQDIKS